MDNTSQVSFSADALDRLNQTLSQYQISRIASISVPEFRGQPNEDVRDFLKRFKMATLSFDDRTRCVALNKALLGSAHTWAKENLKDAISKNDWKAAKKEIINRFALPDQELRHQQKLSRLKFDAKESTLMSYVEEYADTYRKAYREAKDADVIRSLRLNLPDEILLNLNILSDDWSTLESLGTLYPLIRRVESKIMPYESKEKAGTERADIASIANMLKELQSAIAKKEAEPAEAKPQESIAALRTRSPEPKRVRFDNDRVEYPANPERRYRSYGYRGGRGQKTNRASNTNRIPELGQNFPRMLPGPSKSDPMPDADRDLLEAYYRTHGKPPNPCYTCRGNHFNRHCPFKDVNLN